MKYGLTEAQLQTILAILAKHADIEEAILFGSRAMGTYKEASDIDIAIKGEKLATTTVGTVKLQMEDTYLPFFVDVVDYTRIDNPAFIEHIDTKGVSIYRKGWQEYILEDAVEKFIDYRGKTPAKTDAGIPLVTAKIVKNGRIQTPNEFVSEDTYAKWMTRGFPKNNDVVLTTEAPLGEVALLKDENVALAQRIILMRGKPNVLNNGFLKYYFQSREGQHLLQSRASGTTVFGIKAAVLKKIPILIPALPEQKAITAVLASLDDKIDLLHRQNKTLEALAQTLFRRWFIDGADNDWEDGCLGDISENIRDGVKHDQVPNGTIYIGLEHIDKKSIALNRHGLSDDVNSNKYQFVEEDVLFGKLRPYFHKVCFTPFSGICSTDIMVLRPKKPDYFCFCLFAFYQKDVIDYANLGSSGTRMPRTNWKTLKEYPIALPPEYLKKQFNDMIYPSIKKIRTNLSQIRTLEELRDTLLPKLMSGEVRIRQN